MAYDPKKTRAKQKEAEPVVDLIFDEEKPKTSKPASKKPAAKKEESKKDIVELKVVNNDEVVENVHASSDPLITQPQVWVTLAASAIVALMIIKRRRRK